VGTDGYERLRPGMTEDEIKAVIDRARIKAAGSAVP
jgi:Xaa-Pro aminopeptidase